MPLASKPHARKEGLKDFSNEAKPNMGACAHLITDMGFGLAEGGYGAYEYCLGCGEILSKTQEAME